MELSLVKEEVTVATCWTTQAQENDQPKCCVCARRFATEKMKRFDDPKIDPEIIAGMKRYVGVSVKGLSLSVCHNCVRAFQRLKEKANSFRSTGIGRCLRSGGKLSTCIDMDTEVHDHWRRIGAAQRLRTDTEIAAFLIQQYEKPTPGINCSTCDTPVKLTRVVCSACKQQPSQETLTIKQEIYSSVDTQAVQEATPVTPVYQESGHEMRIDVLSSQACFLQMGERKEVLAHHSRGAIRTKGRDDDTDADRDLPDLGPASKPQKYMISQDGNVATLIQSNEHSDHAYNLPEGVVPRKAVADLKLVPFVRGHSTKTKPLLLPKGGSLLLQPCLVCGALFKDEPSLEEHLQMTHGKFTEERDGKAADRNKLACKICKDTFDDPDILQKHEQVHAESKKRYVCNVCWRPFRHPQNWRVHVAAHAKPAHGEQFQCTFCNRLFTRKQGLKEHMRVHTGDKPFDCDLCGKTFRWMGNLRKHRMLHFGRPVKPHECEICGNAFMSPRLLRLHIMTKHSGERPFQCDRCGRGFTTNFRLRAHLEIRHRDTSNIAEKCFVCEKCGISFSSVAFLNIHQKNCLHCKRVKHTKSKTGRRRTIMPIESWELRKQCEDCNKKFTTVNGLRKHCRSYHSESEARPHVCGLCGKKFYYKYEYTQHMMLHTGEKPFACEQCSAAFNKSVLLRYHVAHVHEGKPSKRNKQSYKCKVCGKSLSGASALKGHMYTHTGERPYACPTCGETFRHQGTLGLHIRIGHNPELKPFICGVCGTAYRTRYGLRLHAQKQGHNSSQHINLVAVRAPKSANMTTLKPIIEVDVATEPDEETVEAARIWSLLGQSNS